MGRNNQELKLNNIVHSSLLIIPITLCPYSPILADAGYVPSMNEIASGIAADNLRILIIAGIIIGLILVGIPVCFLLIRKKKQSNDPLKKHPVTLDSRTTRPQSAHPHLQSLGSIQGRGQRENQQDAIGISHRNRNGQLLIVADGMGGLENGHVSSQMAVSDMLSAFQTKSIPQSHIPEALKTWITHTNQRIWQTFQGNSGTTIICVWISYDNLFWIASGDSPLYVLRQGRLYRINEIHNRINDLYLSFMHENITAEELMKEEQKDNLTSNLGRKMVPLLDRNIYPFEIRRGDRFLLCTDGISGVLDESVIITSLQLSNAQLCCNALNGHLIEQNSPDQDNYSAIAVFY